MNEGKKTREASGKYKKEREKKKEKREKAIGEGKRVEMGQAGDREERRSTFQEEQLVFH